MASKQHDRNRRNRQIKNRAEASKRIQHQKDINPHESIQHWKNRNLALRRWEEQDHKCAYCECVLAKINVTIDHIRPLSKGGSDKYKNIAAACKMCNMAKSSLSKDEFIKELKKHNNQPEIIIENNELQRAKSHS